MQEYTIKLEFKQAINQANRLKDFLNKLYNLESPHISFRNSSTLTLITSANFLVTMLTNYLQRYEITLTSKSLR